jgi:hypothetical protein
VLVVGDVGPMLHLTVEKAVLDPEFQPLFTDQERAVAERRLRDAGGL